MIDLHVTRQTFDFDCGAKALQTVMAYYGVEVREDELMETLGTGEDGTSVAGMIAIARKHGFDVKASVGWTLREVKRMVEAGIPVIVLLQAWADRYMKVEDWLKDYDDGHYAIVIAFEKGVLLFEDPASFRRTWLREREFLARWHDRDSKNNETYEHFGMVLLGKEPTLKAAQHMD
ncbi:MAG: C39 family peptidase [Deltaproteobacteria bacterium]|nr:C39 family peptidase [Deltaproteobacteria bacterium]